MRIFGYTAFALALFLTPVQAQTLSLSDAVRTASQNHPSVLEATSEYRMAIARLRQSTGRYAPSVDLSATLGPQYVDKPNSLSTADNKEWRTKRQADLSASLVLFDGFDRANDVYARIAGTNASSYAVFDRTEQIALAAVEAFLDVIRHRNILLISQDNVRNHRTYLSQINESFENGGATGGDVAQARERLRASEKVVAEVREAVGLSNAKFEAIIGSQPQRLKGTAYPKGLPANSAQAVARARNNHPALKTREMAVSQSEFESAQAKSAYLPTLSLDGSASLGEDIDGTPGRNNEFFVGMNLSWNLFDGGIKNARDRELQEQVGLRKHQLDQTRREIDLAVRDAWTKKVSGDDQVRALGAQLQEAQRMVAAFKQEYEVGTRSYFDLMTAESNRFNLRIELSSAKTVSQFSRYQLLAAMGQLLNHFGITPPEQPTLIDKPGNALGFALSNGFTIKPMK